LKQQFQVTIGTKRSQLQYYDGVKQYVHLRFGPVEDAEQQILWSFDHLENRAKTDIAVSTSAFIDWKVSKEPHPEPSDK
jgi:hypothetical protein